MAPQSNGEIIRRYWAAHAAHDWAALGALRHPDWTVEWPQSNERIRGHANDRAMAEAYPTGMPGIDVSHVVGSDDQWVLGSGLAAFTVHHIVGTGDSWWTDGVVTYGDGSVWFVATLFELRDGRILRETSYFAPKGEPPEWRRAWVEPIA